VIDTRTVSASIALIALGIQERLARGTTDEEVDGFVARYQAGHHLLFTVSTLEYLAKGGRIGRAAALAGNLLNVKPILTIRDGEVVPLKRVRGNQKAFAEFRELFKSTTSDSPNLKVGIAHAAAPERLQALRELVEHERPHARSRSRRPSARWSALTPGREPSASSGSSIRKASDGVRSGSYGELETRCGSHALTAGDSDAAHLARVGLERRHCYALRPTRTTCLV
jgi:hypothetical protein